MGSAEEGLYWREDATALQIGHRQGKSFIHRCLRRLCCSSNVGRSVASVLESADQRGAMADSLREDLQAHTGWHSLYDWHTAPFYSALMNQPGFVASLKPQG